MVIKVTLTKISIFNFLTTFFNVKLHSKTKAFSNLMLYTKNKMFLLKLNFVVKRGFTDPM